MIHLVGGRKKRNRQLLGQVVVPVLETLAAVHPLRRLAWLAPFRGGWPTGLVAIVCPPLLERLVERRARATVPVPAPLVAASFELRSVQL